MEALRIVFAGTPAFAARHLQALLDAGHHIAAVYTQPDRAAGRGKQLHASPVKEVALHNGIPVHQPISLKSEEAQQNLKALRPDLMIVVAYGLILPQAVLDIPRLGCLNVHASLLPRWRGAAPIERAMLAGDTETGVTIMQMDAGLDTGRMLFRQSTPITSDDDRPALEARLTALGCEALLHTLQNLPALQSTSQQQDDSLTSYASKLEKHEARIDWTLSATQIHRQIRALIGRAPAWTMLDQERIRILSGAVISAKNTDAAPGTIVAVNKDSMDISCGSGLLRVSQLQLPGRNAATVMEVLNARRAQFAPGRTFSDDSEAIPQ